MKGKIQGLQQNNILRPEKSVWIKINNTSSLNDYWGVSSWKRLRTTWWHNHVKNNHEVL